MIRSMRKRIGIFGGSFDPPHRGHLEISKLSIKVLSLDKVYWCVTKKNPFKKKTFFSLTTRIKNSKLLTNKVEKIKIKFFEDRIKSVNTIDLIKYLKKKNKKNIFFFDYWLR